MSAYIIANITVTDSEQYAEYRQLASIAIAAHGAKVRVRGGAATVLEGDWVPERVVVLEFDDVEHAKRFYDSPEYRAARAAREGASVMRMVVVEGVGASTDN